MPYEDDPRILQRSVQALVRVGRSGLSEKLNAEGARHQHNHVHAALSNVCIEIILEFTIQAAPTFPLFRRSALREDLR